jgi:hypothetical protein
MGSSPKNRTSPGRETRGVEAQSSVRKPSVPRPDEDRMQNEYKRARLESQERGMPPREREEPEQQRSEAESRQPPVPRQPQPEMSDRDRAQAALARSRKRKSMGERTPEQQEFGRRLVEYTKERIGRGQGM